MIEMSEYAPPADETVELSRLVADCQARDAAAWEELIRRFSPVVWTVIRSFGLSAADAEDVYQQTWQRLVEHVHKLREPQRLHAWLVTAARRESLKHITRKKPVVYLADTDRLPEERMAAVPTPEEHLLAQTCDHRLLTAIRHLPGPHQALLGLLLVDPPLSYDQIAEMLQIPRGSIGPTRRRILAKIRESLSRD